MPAPTPWPPNEKIWVTGTGTSWIDVRLSYGYFDGVGETEMAQQLVRAVKLLVVERTRVFYEGRSREVGYRVEPGRDTLHRDARTYRERLAEISAEGTAADGRMRLFCAGLTNISGTIAPGTLATMSW